jgi:hypothetical protein
MTRAFTVSGAPAALLARGYRLANNACCLR